MSSLVALALGQPACGRGMGVASDAAPAIQDGEPTPTDAMPDSGRADAGLRCGNGVRESGEACDGADRGGATCTTLGYLGGALTCTAACVLDASACVSRLELCGNGIQEPGEACDGTDLDGATCAALGFRGGELYCTVGCNFETAWCLPPECGDSVVDPGEECDDGNLHPGDGCDDCTVTPGWQCHGDSSHCCRGFWQGPECTGPCVVFVDGRPEPVRRDGTSWATAFARPQEGVDAAWAEGQPCEVWVAEGTYSMWQTSPADRLSLRPGSAVFGGFSGGEVDREARDPVAHPAVLSGRRAVDPDQRVFHVVEAQDAGWALLDGFVITGGDASQIDATPLEERFGGGLRVFESRVEVNRCRFEGNQAERGGGIGVTGDSWYRTGLTVRETVFVENAAGGSGGGLWADRDSGVVDVSRSLFERNTAFGGGGLAYEGGDEISVTDSRFVGNRARSGGGMYLSEPFDESLLEGLLFAENEADRGGALYLDSVWHLASAAIRRSVLVRNSALRGGAIVCYGCSRYFLSGLTFADNVAIGADGSGGAIDFGGMSVYLTMSDAVFSGNRAASGPGALGSRGHPILVYGTVERTVFCGNTNEDRGTSGVRGAAVAVNNSFLRYESCVFAGNHGRYVGAVEQDVFTRGDIVTGATFVANVADQGVGAILSTRDGTWISDSIFWDNIGQGGAQIAPMNSFYTGAVHRCLVQGGNPGTEIQDTDPLFRGYPSPVAVGHWTDVSYDPGSFQTTLRDTAATWEAGAWEGFLVRPTDQDVRWLHVAASGPDTLTLWGDFTAWIAPGDAYSIFDLRLSPASPAIDAADDTYAALLDLDGQPRVDFPGAGIWPDISDLGAYECQP